MSPTRSSRIFFSSNGAESRFMSVVPFPDLALRADHRALPAVSPAHVGHADKVGSGHAIQRGHLAAEERGLAAEAHRPDSELVGRVDYFLLELREVRMRVTIIHLAQELLLGMQVPRRAI